MKLYSGPMSMFGAKAQIALAEKGLPAEVMMVPFGVRQRYEPKHPEVVRINPKGQVPVLIDGSVEVADSTQIFEYLEDAYPEPALWPRDAAGRSMARQLEHRSDEVFFPSVIRLMAGPMLADADRASAIAAIDGYRERIDGAFGTDEYLAGGFGFADIAYFMAEFFAVSLGALETSATPRLNAWRRLVAARPAVRATIVPMAEYMSNRGMTAPAFLELPSDQAAGGSGPAPGTGVTLAHSAQPPRPRSGGNTKEAMQ